MKIIFNVILRFTIVLLCFQNMLPVLGEQGFGGYASYQRSTGTGSSSTNTSTDCSASGGTCCPSGQQCCANGCAAASDNDNQTSATIPSFNINLLSSSNTILHTHAFNPPSFTLSTAVLEVHIFPPSNSVDPKKNTVTYNPGQGENTYIVAYTIKDPAGSMVHKEFSKQISLPSLPHGISITNSTTGQSTPAITYVSNNFLPPISSTLGSATKMIILNGITPIIQKFVIQNSSNSLTITSISGIYDADSTTSTTPSYSGIANFSTSLTTGTTLRDLTIAFTNSSNTNATNSSITFAEKSKVQFNEQDLANGLALNIVIFPASNSTSYPVVATLRTLDGLKMRKKHAITNNPLTFIPTQISIIHGNQNATILLTTSFLNSSIANNIFTMISPLNLRFLISRPTGSNNFMVLMV
jgi:hypothetical protein